MSHQVKMLFALGVLVLAAAEPYSAQQLPAASIGQPPTSAWPTYNGDYSGRRFSPLTQINASNVSKLEKVWTYHPSNAGVAGLGGFAGWIKSTPLEVNGVLYFSIPDNVWAVDARTGHELWHYKYPPSKATHIGSRGVAMWGDWLYFESPDCNLISLNAKDGTVRWQKQIADPKLEYFCTMSPLVVRNHLVVGVGGDSLDNPGYLESRDPETGDAQWHWNVEPKPGEPGSETWPDIESMSHGGGMTWMTGTYDPELNLIYWGTGNPNPVHASAARKGDNLWTCSIVALNPDTGKMAWYYQVSPHDTHDWDAVQTPVLFDAPFQGKPRKLVAQGSRNGYFFLLDRATGEHLLTAPFIEPNWSLGLNAKGQPIPDPKKEPSRDGTLVAPSSNGATNWFPPTFDPQSGLFYLNASQNWSIFYLTAEGKAEGFAGRDDFLNFAGTLEAIDYQTGAVRWKHDIGGVVAGLLSTAGGLVFDGDTSGNLIAVDPATGATLWHANVGQNLTNGPITFELDGRQFLVFGTTNALVAFALPKP